MNGVLSTIKKIKPAVIITPGFSLATTKIWLRSWFLSTPYIIWSGHIIKKRKCDSFIRKIQKRSLIRRATGFIAYGTRAKEYLISLGANPDLIEIGINTVNTKFFRLETEKMRSILHKNNTKRLLFIGHFTRRKRINFLFNIVKILSEKRKDFILQLVGDGPEKEKLKNLAEKLNIKNYIRFEGYKQKSEIPKYFAVADCFLFPSEEDIWGLVLVEAMAAGVPCIASIYAGATSDLIKNGISGFAMNFREFDKVAEKINLILENHELAVNISENAKNFISKNINLEKSAEGFVKAINKALNNIYR